MGVPPSNRVKRAHSETPPPLAQAIHVQSLSLAELAARVGASAGGGGGDGLSVTRVGEGGGEDQGTVTSDGGAGRVAGVTWWVGTRSVGEVGSAGGRRGSGGGDGRKKRRVAAKVKGEEKDRELVSGDGESTKSARAALHQHNGGGASGMKNARGDAAEEIEDVEGGEEGEGEGEDDGGSDRPDEGAAGGREVRSGSSLSASLSASGLASLPTASGVDPATLRRIKNTMAARRSRERKMAKLTELESRVASLREDNDQLMAAAEVHKKEKIAWGEERARWERRVDRLEGLLREAHGAMFGMGRGAGGAGTVGDAVVAGSRRRMAGGLEEVEL
ncbi:hypothetical protein HDU93_002329 [Gonapodya sp. JEL0774]|nr:hypothetical protein HDU93_002329 [Gonapodya sp. JEL0774]